MLAHVPRVAPQRAGGWPLSWCVGGALRHSGSIVFSRRMQWMCCLSKRRPRKSCRKAAAGQVARSNPDVCTRGSPTQMAMVVFCLAHTRLATECLPVLVTQSLSWCLVCRCGSSVRAPASRAAFCDLAPASCRLRCAVNQSPLSVHHTCAI